MPQMRQAFAHLLVHLEENRFECYHLIGFVDLVEVFSKDWNCSLEKVCIFLYCPILSTLVHSYITAEQDEEAVSDIIYCKVWLLLLMIAEPLFPETWISRLQSFSWICCSLYRRFSASSLKNGKLFVAAIKTSK